MLPLSTPPYHDSTKVPKFETKVLNAIYSVLHHSTPDEIRWLVKICNTYHLFLGVGLILKELEMSGNLENTLIIYSSDNGIPFPNGRTNVYDSGIAEPMLISSPDQGDRHNQVTYSLSSLLDIVPTVLDWYGISRRFLGTEKDNEVDATSLTGKSLLPLLKKGNV